MPSRKRQKTLQVGDRARAKTNRRTGTINDVTQVEGHRYYTLSYDEAPQDHFLATPAKEGARLPQELVEPEQ